MPMMRAQHPRESDMAPSFTGEHTIEAIVESRKAAAVECHSNDDGSRRQR